MSPHYFCPTPIWNFFPSSRRAWQNVGKTDNPDGTFHYFSNHLALHNAQKLFTI
jgi:hypothetical protein